MADKKPEILSARFLRLRLKNKMTQEELAQKAGVTKGAVQLLEAGTTGRPQRKTLISYAQALGVSADYLLWGDTQDAGTHDERVNRLVSIWHELSEPEQRVLETLGEALLMMRRDYEDRGVNFQAGHVPAERQVDTAGE